MTINIKIDVNTKPIEAALKRLEAAGANVEPALHAIGDSLELSTRMRFDTGTAPDGSRWKANSLLTQKQKKGRNEPLVRDGHLRDTLRKQVSGNTLVFGSDRPYAAFQQLGTNPYTIKPKNKKALAFGGIVVKKVNHPGIPARPFLGISKDDEKRIAAIITQHMQNALK